MKRGKRVVVKEKPSRKKMTKEEVQHKKKVIKSVFFTIIAIIVIGIAAMIANDYIIIDNNKRTNLVINNKNVTSSLKNDVLIENDVIYLSKQDIANFFDKHIYQDDKTKEIITTYDKKIAEIGLENKVININGSDKQISSSAIEKDGQIYLPISEMADVYNIEISNIQESNIVTMDSLDKEQKRAIVNSNIAVKSTSNFISKTVDRVKKGDAVIVVNSDKGYTKVRTANGKVGIVKSNKLENEFAIRENMEEEKQISGKVNLTWDYYSEYASAPDRSGTKIDGVNVVSPAFFYLDTDGKLKENAGNSGKAYVKWAKDNGYKVWPIVSNGVAANKSLSITSNIMNDYEKRKELIEDIVSKCVEYELDGINIDFENMKSEDKDMFSRFIIELEPRLKEIGMVLSVDVTAPDGGDTWSMCFDRNVIGDVSDYIIFMAYDQNGSSSTKPGTTAGYNWVKLNLVKFLQTEEIEPDKLILAVPFYTRVWTTNADGKVISNGTLNIKNTEAAIPDGVDKQWNDELKQNYVTLTSGNNTKQIWIEDLESLKAKISLIKDNDLAGVASWEYNMASDDVWPMIKQELNK